MLSSKRVWKMRRTWGFFTPWNVQGSPARCKCARTPPEGGYSLSGNSLMKLTTSSAWQKQTAVKVSAAP